MLSPFFSFYFGLLALGILLAFLLFKRRNLKSLYIFFVLTATLFTEIVSLFAFKYKIKGFDYTIHVFNVLEYTFFSLYYLAACKSNALKSLVRLSIPVFALLSLALSLLVYRFELLPVANIDIEGFLLFIMYSHLLFNLNDEYNLPIYHNEDFWTSCGLMIFFGGIFFFLGVYPVLFHIDATAALQEYGFIIKPLDIIFYGCIVIGQICLLRNRKFSTQ